MICLNKIKLIKSPELYQGQKKMNSLNSYFEGWYFRNYSDKYNISFIPSISSNGENKSAFIQVITNSNSYFVSFPFEEFKFSNYPFYIKIANNFFSKDKIHIDISSDNLFIKGTVNYSNISQIQKSLLSPNIMGPFCYLPFMECNHAILSMKHEVNGSLSINDNLLEFDKGIGYIEKDWGTSFPKNYIWIQANNFKNSETSFFLSIANIPLKLIKFTGFICVLNTKKEYRFTTYNMAKIEKIKNNAQTLEIILTKEDIKLSIIAKKGNSNKLIAPNKRKHE